MQRYKILLIVAATVALLDQLTKVIIIHYLPLHHSIHIVSGFFDITHIRNRGTAFGMFRDGSVFLFLFLIAVSIAALAVIFLIYRKVENNQWYRLALSLIVGGAVGNLIDRIRLGEVIDFLDVYIGQYHWPAFNVADSAITIGVFLAVLSFKEGKGS